MSARGRATYLDWLSGGRADPSYNAGYMFLYFYGLERRFFVDAPPDFERREIVAEVRRLHALYSSNNSAKQYLSTFLEAAALVIAPEVDAVPDISRGLGELPLDLKVAIGRRVNAGMPLTAEWLRAWYLADPETKLRTPARRCRPEFEALFDVIFTQRHPEGLTIKPPKRSIKATYRAASRTFEVDITDLVGHVPDVGTLRKPMSMAATIGDEAMADLDGLSRLLGRDPEARGTLAAHALLPLSIRQAFPCAEGDALRDWSRDIVRQGGTIPAVDLLEKLDGARPDRLTRKALIAASDALGTFDIGMAPDPRFALRAPKLGEPVVLFDLPEGTPLEVSVTFGETALRLGLATMIAHADGTIDAGEEKAIGAIISDTPGLSEAERLRLTATARWMRDVPPDMALLRKRAKAAPDEGKAALGRIALEMANADGQVMPDELKQIEKVYKLLDLDPATIYSDLHAIAAIGDDPVMVRPASTGRTGTAIPQETKTGGVALDTSLIASIRKDTKEVSTLLAGIFSGEEGPSDEEITTQPEPSGGTKTLGSLSEAQTNFARELATQDHWNEDAFEALASRHGLMSAGALETLNEWSFSTYDRAYLDEYNGYDVDPEIAADIGE